MGCAEPGCNGVPRIAGERVLKFVPGKQAAPGSRLATTMCACGMCEGSGEQTCVNCLGEGTTMPDKFPWTTDYSIAPPLPT